MESNISINNDSRKCLLCQTPFWIGGFVALVVVTAAGMGYWLGNKTSQPQLILPPELLHASATHGGSNLAVATGAIDENSEGIFFLDFITGDLQCWIYYPRTGAVGAKYVTNVTVQLPGGKNADYLMVTGGFIAQQAGSNTRLSHTLVYVVDVRSGLFATYGVPWNRSLENSGQPQMGQLVAVGGGQFRNPTGGAAPIAVPPANPANPPKK